ncbi:MAG: ribose 5-phosphate isomerase B [Chthonomonadales bacterium]|nr:ribose 5-phosphate isomerase B [Chthonomonadales bacterium]
MHVVIAADHAGIQLKRDLIETLGAAGHTVTDLGAQSEESCDYPDYAVAAANKVASGEADKGVLICGTGIGMSISANKVPGIRAAAVSDPVSAKLARSHNDANIVCLGARIVGPEVAAEIVQAFVATPFSGGERHVRRVGKIMALDCANRPEEV